MLITWRGMFLVKYSLYNPRFFSHSIQTDFYGFFSFCKVKPSYELYSLLHECLFFSFKLFPWQMILSSNVPKKQKTQFWFRLGFTAIKHTLKQLWCNADIQIIWEFSSVVHLYWKKCCFSMDAFVLCWHKVFSFIAITVPVHHYCHQITTKRKEMTTLGIIVTSTEIL